MVSVRYGASVSGVVQRKLQRAAAAALRAGRPVAVEPLEDRRLFAAAALDPSFSGDGIFPLPFPANINAVALQSDGKTIGVGVGGENPGSVGFLVVRLNTNGTLDTSFGGGDGYVNTLVGGTSSSAIDVEIASDGKIVVGGNYASSTGGSFAVARFLPNGSLDNTFSGDGKATFPQSAGGFAVDMELTSGGKIVVAGTGSVSYAGDTDDLVLGRFNANGSIDTTFGGSNTGHVTVETPDYFSSVRALTEGLDGRLYVGGSTPGPAGDGDNANRGLDMALYGFTANGVLDASFGTTAPGLTVRNAFVYTTDYDGTRRTEYSRDEIVDLAVDANGNVVALAGAQYSDEQAVDQLSDQVLARFTPSGTVTRIAREPIRNLIPYLSYMQNAGFARPAALESVGGKLVVTGVLSTRPEEQGEIYVARFNADFSRDTTLNPYPTHAGTSEDQRHYFILPDAGNGRALAANAQGRIVVAGSGVADERRPTFYNFAPTTSPVPPADVDDTLAEARPLNLYRNNGTVSGRTYWGTDVSMYKFTVDGPRTMTFDLDRSTGSGLDSYLRLFDGAGNQLAANDNGTGSREEPSTDSFLSYRFATAGTYYIGVSGVLNASYDAVTGNGDTPSSWGGYSLTVGDLSYQPFIGDPGNRIATAFALPLGTTFLADVQGNDDIDMIAFTVKAGQRVAFDIDPSANSPSFVPNAYLRLFNAAGTQLAANGVGQAPNEAATTLPYLEYTFPTAGTYYVGVSSKGNESYNPTTGVGTAGNSVGVYTMSLMAVANPTPGTVTLQAESATLGGGTVANSTNKGYLGSGYADFAGAGSSAQFTVNRPASGFASLAIRYANGSAANRPFNVVVNGATIGQFACPPTGSGSTWQTLSLSNVSLAAGNNTIRLVAVGAGADLDQLTVTTTPPPANPATVTLQGEAAAFGGGTVANAANAGYTGSGYADFAGAGSYAQFTVNRGAAGKANLGIRYANGSSSNRPFDVVVNGVKVGQVACPPTGSGSTWATLTLANVSLSSGSNTIRLVAVGYGADLDQLVITTL
jgi:uncharacterized delta-60 repeat protein